MRIYSFGTIQHWESSDIYYKDSSLDWLGRHVQEATHLFTRRKLFREIIELNAVKKDLEGYILLNAHGTTIKGEWSFCDGKRKYSMQNWIDKMDGQAAALLLACCNRDNIEVSSQSSILIHPSKRVSFLDILRGAPLRIQVPGEGYPATQYELRRTIDKLRGNEASFK